MVTQGGNSITSLPGLIHTHPLLIHFQTRERKYLYPTDKRQIHTKFHFLARHPVGPKGWRPFRYLFMIDKGERLQADISCRELQIRVSNRISAA